NVIQPPVAPDGVMAAATLTVPPAVTLTMRLTVAVPSVTTTRCWPAGMAASTRGVTPRDVPSTRTRAPGGSDVISRRPEEARLGTRSTNGCTVALASTVSGRTRVTVLLRSCSVYSPGGIVTRSG